MTAMVAVKLSSGKVLELTELEFNEIRSYFNPLTWTAPYPIQPTYPWVSPASPWNAPTVTYVATTSEK